MCFYWLSFGRRYCFTGIVDFTLDAKIDENFCEYQTKLFAERLCSLVYRFTRKNTDFQPKQKDVDWLNFRALAGEIIQENLGRNFLQQVNRYFDWR